MIKSISEINTDTDEGKLAMMLLAEVTTTTRKLLEPDEAIQAVTAQYEGIFE